MSRSVSTQDTVDARNASFWNELCGTGLARSLGLTDHSAESLRRFDEAYLGLYPYLAPYVTEERLEGKEVLEIGLGYGTLGHLLASRGCRYAGLDIADNPVAIMRYRLSLLGRSEVDRVRRGSALDIPFGDGAFDYVYSIGCLHHTGNLPRAVSEVHRVLKPGGHAIVMLYNRHSFRQLVQGTRLRLQGLFSNMPFERVRRQIRCLYDSNSGGEAAPHTDYVSRHDIRTLFRMFREVTMETRNFDTLVWLQGRLVIPRERLLDNVARVIGLDWYVRATK